MLVRRVTLLLCAVASLTACGVGAAADTSVPPTLPLGELPSSLPPEQGGVGGSARPTTTLPAKDQVGSRAAGNRVIIIGDSVIAGTSKRYSNDMCTALVPLGWQVEVDAETGRFVEFGNQVLDKRLSAGWDATVILLGNNYVQNQDSYRQQLDKVVRRFSPRPVVLLTVSEFISTRQQVNAVIQEMKVKYSNVMIVDWGAITKVDKSLLSQDHLHPSPSGRKALAANVALAMGKAPKQPGKCMSSLFTDDSMSPVTGTTAPGSSSQKTTTTIVGSASSTPADTKSATSTTPTVSLPTPPVPVV